MIIYLCYDAPRHKAGCIFYLVVKSHSVVYNKENMIWRSLSYQTTPYLTVLEK